MLASSALESCIVVMVLMARFTASNHTSPYSVLPHWNGGTVEATSAHKLLDNLKKAHNESSSYLRSNMPGSMASERDGPKVHVVAMSSVWAGERPAIIMSHRNVRKSA